MIEHDLETDDRLHRVHAAYHPSCRSVNELAASGLTSAERLALALFLAELLARQTR